MEHSFKRRKLSPRTGRSIKAHHIHSDEMVSNEEEGSESARSRLKSRAYGSLASPNVFADHIPRSPKGSTSKDGKLSALHPRDYAPTQVAGSVQAPARTVVSSVVQVDVNDGNGSEVTELLVPIRTKVISLPGFAPITLANNPVPTSSSPNTQGYQNPSTRAAASSNAAQTVQASKTPSNAASSSSSASSSPTSIVIAGSQSQAVLSSPPSTPLPSSPSPSPSPSSTGSYFSSSSGAAPASNLAQSSAASQTTNGQSLPSSNNGNSTASVVPSTTFSRASTSNPAIFTTRVNSTLITSTRSSSSQTTGAFLTSSLSSGSPTSSLGSSSSTSATASQTPSLSSFNPSISSSSSNPSSSVAIIGGGAGGSGETSATSSAPSSTAGSGGGSGGGEAVSTPAVVGGVVGGVAGFSIILLLLLFLLRRRRAKARQRTISPPIPQTLPPAAGTGATTERSSVVPFAAGAFLRRMRPGSGQTAATTDTAPSERGFQNMGGRKLESVLSSRGDGYSDPATASGVPRNYGGTVAGLGLTAASASRGPGQGQSPGPYQDETLSGSSFYRDSHGFYGGSDEAAAGPSSSPSTSPTAADELPSQAEEIAVTRPGPARTPVINQPGFAPLRQPGTGRGTPPPGTGRGTPPPRALTPQPRQQDDVGRSHPSFDGSRGSRFAEDV